MGLIPPQHSFRCQAPDRIIDILGEPEQEPDDGPVDGTKKKLSQYFGRGVGKAAYVHDFDDEWIHDVGLEDNHQLRQV